jgi:3D (Asp-Asp-Asp) domain-containing protein
MYLGFNLKKAARILSLALLFDLSCVRSVVQGPSAELEAYFIEVPRADSVTISQSPQGLMKYLGKFKVTFYWIIQESEYSGTKDTPLYLESGKVLGYFPSRFVSDFKKEACAELKSGKLISYLKRVNKVRVVTQFLGFNGYTISPFKSIAVDPSIVPLGSKLYIPALTQMGKDNHNGVVYAHDIGSMINGHSIDIFVGYKSNTRLLTSAGIESSSLVDVYLLE